ncbi:hypothetical protein GQR58_006716 [Nymphon striatum]|nr:hypothetical protein GQR58_006716 [Nymphon striatum]
MSGMTRNPVESWDQRNTLEKATWGGRAGLYSRGSTEAFGGSEQLVRVLGSWASNQNMSSQILAFEDAYKHTDAVAIGPYVSAHPKVLRKTKSVDEVFKAMMDKESKHGMKTIISYIKKQQKVASSFGVDLIAYEGGQHLVDWNTRKVDEHPNPLLYAANRDPRMGIVYDELMREWKQAGGKLFVAFSAPRIYSWYGSWGVKEHIRQSRADAPKYDSLLRYLDSNLYPEKNKQAAAQSVIAAEQTEIIVPYAKKPEMIWNMQQSKTIPSKLSGVSASNLSANWQSNWDTKHLYFSFSVNDNDIQKGDEIVLTLDTTEKDTEDSSKNKNSTENPETKEAEEDQAKTYTFSPFDSLGSQTHLIRTDTGYLLNVAIPWSELFGNESSKHASNGYKVGLNIKIIDIDEDLKGSKTLIWADTHQPLPKLVLSNTPHCCCTATKIADKLLFNAFPGKYNFN